MSALISLRQILDYILDSGGRRRNRAHLECLHEQVSFLLDFLENAPAYMETQKSEVKAVGSKIRDAAYKAKSLIRFLVPWTWRFGLDSDRILIGDKKFGLDSGRRRFFTVLKVASNANLRFLSIVATSVFSESLQFMNYQLILSSLPGWIQFLMLFFVILALAYVLQVICVGGFFILATIWSEAQESRKLPSVINEFNVIVRNVIEIKDACGNPSPPPPLAASSSSSFSRQNMGGTKENVVVGLDSDLIKIKARLLHDSSKRELASIVGMGGIGKTTLARQVYKDPGIGDHFDVHTWVTVTQEYSFHHVLLSLLDSAQILIEEMRLDSDDNLALYLYQYLIGRRYLIVMDDVWGTDIWDSLSRFLPENGNGSHILITSRLPDVATPLDSISHLHHMQCLNEDEGWCLLREKVFGAEDCPSELESIGRGIAVSCGGLPLAIIVIGGLLYKEHRSEIWIDIEMNLRLNSNTEDQCLEILGLSYNHLPLHLRPCFLYMGVFPRNCEIPVSKLISLWAAEGFLEPSKSKNLEEVAEDNLKDLIDWNLILACEKAR